MLINGCNFLLLSSNHTAAMLVVKHGFSRARFYQFKKMSTFITIKDLAKVVKSTDRQAKPVILDVSVELSGNVDYRERFVESHIKGAQYFDFRHGTKPTETFPYNIPSPICFQNYCQSFGIDNESDIVLYEAMPEERRLLIAGRVWWLFRYFGHEKVQVLDATFKQWCSSKEAAGLTESGLAESPEAGTFKATVCDHLLADYKLVSSVSKSEANKRLVDTRTRETFAKSQIPNSVNIPWTTFFTGGEGFYSQLCQSDKVKEHYKDQNINVDKEEIIFSCQAGITACSGALIASAAGIKNWRVYIGSLLDFKFNEKIDKKSSK